jgi:hypothetical protein
VRAKDLEELQIWQRALAFAEAISAITQAPAFDRAVKLRE